MCVVRCACFLFILCVVCDCVSNVFVCFVACDVVWFTCWGDLLCVFVNVLVCCVCGLL